MGAALSLATAALGAMVLLLGFRIRGLLPTAGGIATRAVLLLSPPAVRDALTLLRCAPVDVSSTSCASLDGCSSSIGARGSTVTIGVLASNPYYVCWAPGASHIAAGGAAVATIVVVAIIFPLVTFLLLWRRAGCSHAYWPTRHSDEGENVASSMVINPLRRMSAAAGAPPDAAIPVTPTESALLSPFLSDYRTDSWYTRHADLAVTLLLAALQVGVGVNASGVNVKKNLLCIRCSVWTCTGLCADASFEI